MRTIPLTQGMVALVDNADYESLSRHRWYAHKTGGGYYYAERRKSKMHRVILGLQTSDKRQTDHRDGNGLNNQRSNLRICTRTQNGQSSRKRKAGTSKYKGVCWHYNAQKWISYIRVNKKQIYLGLFDSEIQAALVYNQAALKHFGEFALTNKMSGLY